MLFGKVELEQLIRESIKSYGVNPWEYGSALQECACQELEESEEELEEISSMAGGSIEGGLGGGAWSKPDDEDVVGDKWTKLREVVRNSTRQIIEEDSKRYQLQENKLRNIVRNILLEKKGMPSASAHQLTGINDLNVTLQNTLQTIENARNVLTTSKEQREAFDTQFLQLFKGAVEHAIANKRMSADISQDGELDNPPETDLEENDSSIQVVDDNNPFIDVFREKNKKEKELKELERSQENPEFDPSQFMVQDLDPTGRAQSIEVWDQVESAILRPIKKLSDPVDQDAYLKYGLINYKMHFDNMEAKVSDSLSQIDAEPEPGDAVDAEDGLGPGELEQGGPAEDPLMPNDLEKEWRDAENTMVEFYSTAGTMAPRFGPDVKDDQEV